MAWLQGSRLTHGCCMGRHRKWAAVRSYWSSIQSRNEIIFAARQGAPCTVGGTSAHSGHNSSGIQEVHGYSGTFSAFIRHSIQEVHGSAHSSSVIGEFTVWCIHCALVYLGVHAVYAFRARIGTCFVQWSAHSLVQDMTVQWSAHSFVQDMMVQWSAHSFVQDMIVQWSAHPFVQDMIVQWSAHSFVQDMIVQWSAHPFV